MKKLNDQTRKDDVVTFEQLGVDRLFVVNFTDGIDGLNTSVTFFVALFFMLIGTVINTVVWKYLISPTCRWQCHDTPLTVIVHRVFL